ncbi:redox-sensing transcriptional repressor Rex [Tautonia sociabilis]|uniref:Redox-sensing transcriptional repressor Rex n=1 Tax=Tautonia sociabilis TaxID=2080755 RepID=A0A432MQY6_9BACT|nr:redox-sensing transcriptional repressor Rex [Tautonia sociabilis]RUL89790.1 redox-sensing transcriptional repressor Rex [Tautonia sociabilis]
MREPHRDASPSSKPAPKAVVGRLSLYLRQLETFARQGRETVSSSQLGQALGLNDAQVRKDLAYFGQFGQPGLGYPIEDLTVAIRRILGVDRDWPTALIGLGNLGQALLGYKGFRLRRFRIVALFDNDPRKLGKSFDGLTIRHTDELPEAVSSQGLRLAMLCVPAEAAQRVADHVVSSGIRGILNFAPTSLFVPPDVSIVAVDLSVQLEQLAYSVHNLLGDSSPADDISAAG